MIFEEEDVAKILKKDKLAMIGNSMLPTIRDDILKIQNTKNPLSWTKAAEEKYKNYLGDFWELKDEFVSPIDNKALGEKEQETINKIISIWNNAYSELIKLESTIADYNKRFPSKQLKTIEEMTGLKLKASVKTDYFDY